MKTTKRILATLLAVIMLAAMLTTGAFAANSGYTITIENAVSGHTYTAYQIFTGVLSDSTLSDIQWGNAITADGQAALGDAATVAAGLATAGDAELLLTRILDGGYLDLVNAGVGADTTGKITGLSAGYYVVMDTVANMTGHDAYSKHILRVVKDVTVTPKASVPELTKEVSLQERQQYSASVNASFGSTVYFKLVGTMPDHIDDYSTYYYQITDSIPAGLTFNGVMHVYVMNNNQYYPIDSVGYSVDYTNNILTITFTDAKAAINTATGIDTVPEDEILVVYSTTVNDDAVVGPAGNINEAFLTYENNPNNEGTSVGTTPVDSATVYTYQLDINKVNSAGDPLAGATFLLYRVIGNVTEYAVVDGDGNFVASTTDLSQATRLTTDANGAVSVKGITAGAYCLVEESAPAGYNKLSDEVHLTISGASDGNYSFSARITHGSAYATITPTSTVTDSGVATVTITNTRGATLPETGGIGTTIFYIVGAVLVLGAVTLLVTKKRANG